MCIYVSIIREDGMERSEERRVRGGKQGEWRLGEAKKKGLEEKMGRSGAAYDILQRGG